MGQVEAHKIASRLELETIEEQAGLEDAYARAPFGHGERVAESFDKRASKALESVSRPRARGWLEQHIASARTQRMVGALKWERAQADKNALSDLGEERDVAGARAMQDDAQYAPAVEKFTAMAELLGKRGDERVERAIDEIAYQAAQGRVARDPGGTLALLDQRMGLAPTQRGPVSVNLVNAKPDAVAGMLSDLTGTKVEAPAGAPAATTFKVKEGSRKDVVAALSLALGVAPPDTAVEATGSPEKTGVPYIDRLGPAQLRALRNEAERTYRGNVSGLQATVRAGERDMAVLANRGDVAGARKALPAEATYVAAYGEGGREKYAEALEVVEFAEIVGSRMTATEAELTAPPPPGPEPGANPGAVAAHDKRMKFDAKAREAILKARYADPIQAAHDQKIAKIVEIDWQKTDEAIAILKDRAVVDAAMRRTYATGAKPTALTVRETERLRDGWHRIPDNSRAQILRMIGVAVGPESPTYRGTLAGIAPDSVATQVAGNIAAKDGAQALAVASLVLQGEAMLNPGKAAKREDGKPTQSVPLPKDFDKVYAEVVGEALPQAGREFDAGRQSVAAYYVASSQNSGLYGKENADPKRVKEAITQVMGAIIPMGAAKIIAPWGMSGDEARKNWYTQWEAVVRDNRFAGKPESNLNAMTPVPLSEGRYTLQIGVEVLKNAYGAPIVIDIRRQPGQSDIPRRDSMKGPGE